MIIMEKWRAVEVKTFAKNEKVGFTCAFRSTFCIKQLEVNLLFYFC